MRLYHQSRPKAKIEFSKALFVGVTVITLAVTLFACLLMWHTQDASALAYLIPAVYAELAAATGFYLNKAKAENQIKLKQIYGQMANESEDYSDDF